MYNYKSLLDNIDDYGPITISLMVTEACNFRCGHCMYSCHPQKKPKFMSNEIVLKAMHMAEVIRGYKLGVEMMGVEINLIGGEPTLDLDQFERIYEIVNRFDFRCYMTTNGWWLANEDATRKFMSIIARHTNDYGLDDGFSCRISDDQFHSEFRPKRLQNLENIVSGLWDDGVLLNEKSICPECGEELNGMECSEHGEVDEPEYKYDDVFMPPQLDDSNGHWLYVDTSKGTHGIIPTGRGINVGEDKPCSGFNGLTVKPDGKIRDFCCRGSNLRIGTVDDDPMAMMLVALRYMAEGHYCYSCKWDAGTRPLRRWYNQAQKIA